VKRCRHLLCVHPRDRAARRGVERGGLRVATIVGYRRFGGILAATTFTISVRTDVRRRHPALAAGQLSGDAATRRELLVPPRPLLDLLLGRTGNVDIRFAAAVALLFDVLMVLVATIAIALTVRRDGPGVGR
jgi:hypothetical protein